MGGVAETGRVACTAVVGVGVSGGEYGVGGFEFLLVWEDGSDGCGEVSEGGGGGGGGEGGEEGEVSVIVRKEEMVRWYWIVSTPSYYRIQVFLFLVQEETIHL